MIRIAVGPEDFDPGVELGRLEGLGGGGVASFTGIVRGGDGLLSMRLDHYPAMTGAQIERIVAQANARWPLLGVTVIHRVGELQPGERIVFVGTASAGRIAALESCAFLIDWLKTKAPFWKLEETPDGEKWVEAHEGDDAAAARWAKK